MRLEHELVTSAYWHSSDSFVWSLVSLSGCSGASSEIYIKIIIILNTFFVPYHLLLALQIH